MRHFYHIIPAILTWILLALTLTAGTARFVPPSIWAFPQVVCLVLPALVVLCVCAGIAWLATRHIILPVATGVTLLLILPSLRENFPISLPEKPAEDAPSLSLLTYNIHCCEDIQTGKTGSSRALDYVMEQNADIVCLQELYSLDFVYKNGYISAEQMQRMKALYPYTVAQGDIDARIFSKYPLKRVESYFSPALKYFMYEMVEVDVPGHPLTLINLHLTSFSLNPGERSIINDMTHGATGMKKSVSAMKHSVYHKLTEAFRLRAEAAHMLAELVRNIPGTLIVCGDFNDVPGSYSYTVIRKAGLEDAFCDASFGPTVTFNGFNLYFHIDQILYRGALRPYSIERGSLKSSDHYPLTVKFELTL